MFVVLLVIDPILSGVRASGNPGAVQTDKVKALKKEIKDKDATLDLAAYEMYPILTGDEVKTLVVDDKWLASLTAAVQTELDRVSQALTGRVKDLADRYAAPLSTLTEEVDALSDKVDTHLRKMGFIV